MKTDLRLRLHATQAQPCFPAAPPRRQRHFHGNADRAYNTLHFASQSRVPNGGVAPFGNPHKKGGTLPLHGAHTAFSCYPALRLYRLSKSQRGIGVVSLSKRTPMILSMALQAVYNIVDSAFVGNMKTGSESALSALTLVFPVQLSISFWIRS